MVQRLEKYSSTATGTQGVALNEQARRVSDWRRERRWEMLELKGRQQQETEGELAMSHVPDADDARVPVFESSQLKRLMQGTYSMCN